MAMPVKEIASATKSSTIEESEGGMTASSSRHALIPPGQSQNEASVTVEESLETESGAPLTTQSESSVSGYQRLLQGDDDSSTVRPWTMLMWRCVCTLALLLLLLFLIVSGTVWAARRIAAEKEKVTDASFVTSSSSSVISTEVTPTEPDLGHTSTTVLTVQTTTPTTSTKKTTPTTTKATTTTATPPTSTKTSTTTAPTTTTSTTRKKTTVSTTTRPTTAKATTTTAETDSKSTATAKPHIGDCFGRGRTFTFCEQTIPGAYRDMVEKKCYDVRDENLYLCNDGPNRFASAEECQKLCLARRPPLRKCAVVPDLVPCRSEHLKRTWWFYDRRSSRCTEWAYNEGKCPDVKEGMPQYSTESDCMAKCDKNDPSEGCYPTGSDKPCPVSVMDAPYFAFRPEYGNVECYVADVQTMREHRCIDEYRRFTNVQLCLEHCLTQRERQAPPPLSQPLRDTTNGSETRTSVAMPASELLTHKWAPHRQASPKTVPPLPTQYRPSK